MHIITQAAAASFYEEQWNKEYPKKGRREVPYGLCLGIYGVNTTIEQHKASLFNMVFPWILEAERENDQELMQFVQQLEFDLKTPIFALEAAQQGDNIYLWASDSINDLLGLAQVVEVLNRHHLMNHVFLPEDTTGTCLIYNLTPVYKQCPVVFRKITQQETGFFIAFWQAYIEGELHQFSSLAKVQNIQIPDWVTALEYVDFRYPFLENGLPRYLQELLNPLLDIELIHIRRLVANFITGRLRDFDCITTNIVVKSLDGDWLPFDLLYHVSINPKLVEITPIDIIKNTKDVQDYPYGQYNIKLTPKGRAVLLGEETVDLRHIEQLRWWGGKDLCDL